MKYFTRLVLILALAAAPLTVAAGDVLAELAAQLTGQRDARSGLAGGRVICQQSLAPGSRGESRIHHVVH